MLLPKIIFKYSWIYDFQWKLVYEKLNLKDKYGEYPSSVELKDYVEQIKGSWEKVGDKILVSLAEYSGLRWQKDEIIVYVVGKGTIPFSDPLTVPAYIDNQEYFIDVVTHELIHNLLTQNDEITRPYWAFIGEKYPDASRTTQSHLIVHALHTKIYKEFRGEDRLKIDQERLKNEDYVNSWKLVEKEGYENIIQNFKDNIA